MNEIVEIVQRRHNELIDPSLHIWGWEIPVYLFLGGLSAGLIVLPAILAWTRGQSELPRSVRLMPFASLALLSLGMVALMLDLEYKLHVYRFYLAFKPLSPMSWGSWILLIVYPAGLALGLALLTEDGRRKLAGNRLLPRPLAELIASCNDRRRTIIYGFSIVAGIALGTYTGLLLGTLGARPLWNSTILGPLFMVSGLSTAAAFMLLFRPGGFVQERLVRWDMVLIVAELMIITLFVMTLVTGGRASQSAARELLGGKWTGIFWSVVVFLGLLVPLAMEIVESRKHLRPAIMAPILILLGGIALRWILLVAGQETTYALF